ncbi:LysE family translocator [Gallaecimonas mangrovi]|uniref:LysE family translocator n=1 Tax=Gallaecimonas mangrovi TaxID=2291597 RepID=UPI000E2009B3|nr:LysE family translocator [Gallaecimonas mangrovi]
MTINSALSFLLAIYVFCLTPGPGVFAILGRALSRGAGACFWLGLGMASADILYLLAACFGLAAIATHFTVLFMAIRFIGAAYLLLLAYKMWTAAPVPMSQSAAQASGQGFKSFLQGMAISLSNPKVILFYMAFLPTFIDLTPLHGSGVITVVALTLTGLLLGIFTVAGFAAKARLLFRSDKAMRGLNRIAACLMAAAALFLASRS